jgi:hypothetical protein
MKTLQNNFTTIEQSKRLLELGVPADSADCYYVTSVGKKPNIIHSEFHFDVKCKTTPKPCWSVGRLIELYMKAKGLDFMYFRIMSDADMIDSIVRMFVENQNEMDFSKLEE